MNDLSRKLDHLTDRLDALAGRPDELMLVREYVSDDEVTRLYLQGGHVVRVEAFDERTGEPMRARWPGTIRPSGTWSRRTSARSPTIGTRS